MSFFFFHHTATTQIYTLSLHDALPISGKRLQELTGNGPPNTNPAMWCDTRRAARRSALRLASMPASKVSMRRRTDRKSTRLNSSHVEISYAVFCLKKKNKRDRTPRNYQ